MNRVIFDILSQNGWTADRKIDITNILNYLKENNHSINQQQREFLKNFGELEIFFEAQKRPKHKFVNSYNIQIFPTEYGIYQHYLDLYEIYAKSALIPIGGISSYNTWLVLDTDLRIYGVFEYEIALLGENIFEVIENLYENREIYWDVVRPQI